MYPKITVKDEKDIAAANEDCLKTYHHSIVAKLS